MAQPSQFLIRFLGSVEVTAGDTYTTAAILTAFPAATIMIMKSKGTSSNPIKVSINSTAAIEIDFNEVGSITTGDTFVFNQACLIAVGEYVSGAA